MAKLRDAQVDDNKNHEQTGRRAVEIIANDRNSDYLKAWLAGADLNDMTMGVDEALRVLGVEQGNVNSVDDTLWPAIFSNARESKAGQQTERAIAAIQKALEGKTGMPSRNTDVEHAPETWPVGLTSHGNTCYLNSLLQYYFSIKPIRDIVLNYHMHRMEITSKTPSMKPKPERVGQLEMSKQEIIGGQKFADELKHLFERMIKDPEKSVRPEQDLVCRAFLKEAQIQGDEDAIEENPPLASEHDGNVDDVRHDADAAASIPSSATVSSATLQASVNGEADGDVHMQGSEMPPTPPASPGHKPLNKEPENPPPLPPRRFSTTTSDTLKEAEAKAKQQQDVTEVHDGITQRLRAGMLPLGSDPRGEQNDELRNLYALSLSETAVVNDVPQKSAQLYDSSIQLNVPTDDTDLYTELDRYFDLSQVAEGSANFQYKTIVGLPPLVQITMPRNLYQNGDVSKSEKRIRLFDELYLDRYCDGIDPGVLPTRRKAWGWRKRVQELRKEQKGLRDTTMDINGPDAVAESAKFIASLEEVNADLVEIGESPIDTDSELSAALLADANFQVERLKSLEEQITKLMSEIDGAFAEFNKLKYRLAAVFFHRGNHGHGHYWVCIHDFKNNMWRRYNDETVTEVAATDVWEILESIKNPSDTPTFAVYVQDHLKEQYVDPVCRDPEQKVQNATTDVNEWQQEWQQDAVMPDAPPSLAPADGTVNPQDTVNDGNLDAVGDWDAKRPVPDVKW